MKTFDIVILLLFGAVVSGFMWYISESVKTEKQLQQSLKDGNVQETILSTQN